MFKIKFDPKEKKTIIAPEDMLPKTVENTRGELMNFDTSKIVHSLMNETNLEKDKAIKITINVLKTLSSLGLDFVAAPHLRELVCGELTANEYHKNRNMYTRLGIPIFDVKKILDDQKSKKGSEFDPLFTYLWLTSQVVEQYVHLDSLTDSASILIDNITKDARKLGEEEKNIILNSLNNSLKLLKEKEEQS